MSRRHVGGGIIPILTTRTLHLAAAGVLSCSLAACATTRSWRAVAPSRPTAAKDFNLTWESVDANGVPLNPYWMTQRDDRTLVPPRNDGCASVLPDSPRCTDQRPSRDAAQGVHAGVCRSRPSAFPGHINWMPATYTGRVMWAMLADDGDVNLTLVPDEPFRGSTAGNLRARRGGPHIYLEFASNETIDRFASAWWRTFRRDAAAWVTTPDEGDRADRMLGGTAPPGPRAIALGLLGLDCEQDCKTELHPVYAIAIEIDPDPRSNTWVMFARNWGTEGYCGSRNHVLDTTDNVIRLTLPARGRSTPAVLADRSEFASSYPFVPVPALSFAQDAGLTVTFRLPSAQAAAVSELVLRLDWGAPGPGGPIRGGDQPDIGVDPPTPAAADAVPLAVAGAARLEPANARIALPSPWPLLPPDTPVVHAPLPRTPEPDVLAAKARGDLVRFRLLCAQLGTGETVPEAWRRACSQR